MTASTLPNGSRESCGRDDHGCCRAAGGALASDLEVSRNTLREAFRILIHEGTLERTHRGVFVRVPPVSSISTSSGYAGSSWSRPCAGATQAPAIADARDAVERAKQARSHRGRSSARPWSHSPSQPRRQRVEHLLPESWPSCGLPSCRCIRRAPSYLSSSRTKNLTCCWNRKDDRGSGRTRDLPGAQNGWFSRLSAGWQADQPSITRVTTIGGHLEPLTSPVPPQPAVMGGDHDRTDTGMAARAQSPREVTVARRLVQEQHVRWASSTASARRRCWPGSTPGVDDSRRVRQSNRISTAAPALPVPAPSRSDRPGARCAGHLLNGSGRSTSC